MSVLPAFYERLLQKTRVEGHLLLLWELFFLQNKEDAEGYIYSFDFIVLLFSCLASLLGATIHVWEKKSYTKHVVT